MWGQRVPRFGSEIIRWGVSKGVKGVGSKGSKDLEVKSPGVVKGLRVGRRTGRDGAGGG